MSFKQYLAENHIKGTDLVEKIGSTRMRAMSKHPFYEKYIKGYSVGVPAVYRHNKGTLNRHTVQATADGKTMVKFDFYNYKVSNAHLFRWDGHRDSEGNKMWHHVKSYHEDH